MLPKIPPSLHQKYYKLQKIDYVEVEGNGRVVIYLTDGGYEYAQYSFWGFIQMTKGELWKI